MENDQVPEGRAVAEAILMAASQLDTEPSKLHTENDPYYWEPDFPDEIVDSLSTITVIRHNIHYAVMSTYNALAYLGYRILDFVGWSGSEYDWINDELERDKEEKEYERRQYEEDRKFHELKQRGKVVRMTDSLENGKK